MIGYCNWRLSGALLLLGLIVAQSACSHEMPIALLEIRETQSGVYLAQWTYTTSTNRQPPNVVYPQHCAVDGPRLDCGDKGLTGRLTFERLGMSYSAVVVRLERLEQPPQSFTVTGAEPGVTLSPDGRLPLSQLIASYLPLGIEHILLGIDHLLFVFGLMLLVTGVGALIKTITAFTIAHSLTLAAATLGWIGVSEAPVNATIALSIVIVAVEVIRDRQEEASWTGRFPWAVAFGFGLLHGLGFASALTDIGLPPEQVPAALLLFNIGVEIGQIGFVLLVLALSWSHRRLSAELPRWSLTLGVYTMGAVASYWFIARMSKIVDGGAI
jgi:hypothetical protein